MATNSLGQLTLDLVARTGGFVRGMSKAERSSKKWRRQVERDLKKLRGQFATFAKMAAGAGVAAAGAFTIMAKEGLQFVDSQAKMATRLGSTIDDLRAVQIAASDFGIEQSRLTRSLQSYTKRLGDAARGTGEAQKAYEALGLEASELVNLPLPEQLALIAERISQVDSAAERTSIADRLMSGGRNMVNLFEEGGGAIRAAVQEVDEFGLSMSEIDAARVEAANDAIGRIPRALEPIRNQIAINLAEPLSDVADLFNEAAKASNGFAAEVVEGLATAVETIGTMIEGVDDLRISLMKVQRFQLGVSAFTEQARLNAGQGMGRMQNYGLDNPPPETGPATAEYNRLNEEILALEEGGNALQSTAEFMQEQADNIRQGPARRAALQAGVDAGLGMDGGINNEAIVASGVVVESFERAAQAADDAAKALEGFNPAMNDEVQDILDRAGEGSTIDAGGQIRDAWGNALPTLQRELDAALEQQLADFKSAQNLQAGLEAAAQVFVDSASVAAKAAWASVQPQSAEDVAAGVVPTAEQAAAGDSTIRWSTDLGAEKVSQAASQVSGRASGGGGSKQLGTLTLASEAGNLDVFTENADAAEKWLADTLAGVAAGSR